MHNRREFLAAAVAGSGIAAAQNKPRPATLSQLQRAANDTARRILIQGGIVLSMDARTGNLSRGDVLVEGSRITAIGADLSAAARGSLVVDATDRIVMPGFIDTHHHQYETLLRGALADGTLGLSNDAPQNYISVIQGVYTPQYLPRDAHISELVASLNQINAGVTTTVDTSQVSNSPEHTDACIAGLRASGRRAVYAYATGQGPGVKFPGDLARLRRDYFSTNDQLLTLALHTGIDAEQWKLARSLGAPIVSHYISGDLTEAARAGLLGPDNEYIHCTQIGEADWKRIADTGGHVSIAPAIEMQMKHGMPPLQSALDHGLKPSLSVDVECNMAADMFTIMRSAFTLQRALANQRSLAGEKNAPKLMTAREAIEMATLHGARCAHLESKIGSLAPGKEADIILLATDRINVFPLNNVEGAVVTLMDTSNVDTVFIAGQVRKWRGALVGHDLAALRREMDRARDALFARAKRGSALFGSCCAP